MLAALTIPRFAFRVTARAAGVATSSQAVIAPLPGEQRVGEPSAAASAAGVREGMYMAEALARCPALALLPADPVQVARAAERFFLCLEDAGAAVEPLGPGRALIDIEPIRLLYHGLDGVLAQLRARSIGARIGVAPDRFTALVAARSARHDRAMVVEPGSAAAFLAPRPADLLVQGPGISRDFVESIAHAGLHTLGSLAQVGRLALRDRYGPEGERAYALATGTATDPFRPRRIPLRLRVSLPLPEGSATIGALVHAARILIERLLAMPDRKGQAPRTLRLEARTVGGGSWQAAIALREPTVDPARLLIVLRSRLETIPAPAEDLSLEIVELATGLRQPSLLSIAEDRRQARLHEAIAHLRATAGPEAALRIVEIDPDSRIPERRFGVLPA